MGDFLVGGQGEDVVAGTHHTHPITEMARRWPVVAGELTALASKLEHDLGDVADIEFTVERGRLWILQARVGKRSPQAAIRLAVAMAEDAGFPLDRAGAVARVSDLLDDPPVIATTRSAAADELLASGLAASPGHASGRVCVDPDEALRRAEQGEPVILVRRETSPADVHGMAVANGLVTQLGGLVSHAAVVARAWGIPAVVGVGDLAIDDDGIRVGSRTIGLGDTITVDGDQGRILLGAHAVDADEMAEVVILRAWRDELRRSGDGSPGAAVADDLQTGPTGSATSVDVLRALALKGMATAEAIASFLLAGPDTVVELLGEAVTRDQAQAGPGDRYLLTPDGTAAVDSAFAAEAVAAAPAIEPHLARFHQLNGRFKEVVTGWQMRELGGEQVMNDHTDAAYDASILLSLSEEIHTGIVDVIAAIEDSLPRLGAYRIRLQTALDGLEHGDLELMAHPLRDSYHTVWFELHEELIRLSGRNRADEAAAGRA